MEEGKAGIPDLAEARTEDDAAQAQKIIAPAVAPEHARLFEPAANDALASGFDHAAADEVALLAKVPVAGALGVGMEAGDLALDDLDLLGGEVRAMRRPKLRPSSFSPR